MGSVFSQSAEVTELKQHISFGKQKMKGHTSVQVWTILSSIYGDVNGGAVPAHISEGLLAGFFDFAGSLNDGLHQLQVAATQLSLG